MTCVSRPGATVQPLAPPTVPDRTSSLTSNVTPADDLLYLVGRKPFTHNIQDTVQISSSPDPSLGINGFMDQLLDTSTDDSASVYSATSSVGGRPGSGSLHRGLAKTASDALSRVSAESDHSRRLVRTRSPGLAVAQPAISSEESTQSSKECGRETRRHQGLRSTKSLPPQPEECEEPGSGLVEIKEGEELRSPRNSLDREVSPDLLSLPVSPTRKTSPGNSRKTRMATRRGSANVSARKAKSSEWIFGLGFVLCFKDNLHCNHPLTVLAKPRSIVLLIGGIL